jgi:ABC-type transport system substrate-binding protein
MVSWVSQVTLVAVAMATFACESPARVKPWRHAPDPVAEAAKVSGSPALADAQKDSEAHVAREHTLRVHVDADPGRLHPLVAPSVWGRRITHGTVFEPLLRYVPPEPGQPAGRFTPRLARSWRVVVPPWGGLEIRLELEPNVKFHDGRPLTSSDVQFTLDTIRDPRRGIDHLRPMLADVQAVELITPTEVRLVLERPSGYVLRALAEIPILPMHVHDGNLLAGGALVGSGPYKLVSHKGGVVHLTRHDRYWGPKPAIADIEFIHEPDAAVALRQAKRGALDIVPALIPAHYPEQAAAPGISAVFAPLALRPPRLRYLAFNASKAPLDDVRVRQALALLLDRREIAEGHFRKLARPALWPIWSGGLVHGEEPAIPAFDPKAAGALLDAAGWIDSDKDGIRDRNGVQLRIVMVGVEHDPPEQAIGAAARLPRQYLIDAARRAHVVIELKTGNEAWVAKRIKDGNYHLAEGLWNGMVDMDVRARLASAPAIATVLDRMAAAWDPAERARLSGELATGLATHWPLAGIVADAPQGLIHRRVKNVRAWDGWIDLTQLSLAAE